jgi:hypothetical protein
MDESIMMEDNELPIPFTTQGLIGAAMHGEIQKVGSLLGIVRLLPMNIVTFTLVKANLKRKRAAIKIIRRVVEKAITP